MKENSQDRCVLSGVRLVVLCREAGQMKTLMNTVVAVLFLATIAVAKNKTLADYPMQFEVLSQDFTGRGTRVTTGAITSDAACQFVARDKTTIYVVENRNFMTCHTFTPGTVLSGREAQKWGVSYIEFAWTEKGKLKTQKYTLLSKGIR
jgi:hypothetical protein